ncbi:MAG: hypothetical protein PF483_12715 [Halothiobacillus sp.]|jgi:hypothetical protein|nr:hypothetical protein [Halothiobacillus sp.]
MVTSNISKRKRPAGRAFHQAAEGGFGLLEAIVALVLISVAVMAAYDWISTNLITISRIQDIAAKTQAENNLLGYMANINPMQNPAGSQAFLDYQLLWQSKPISPLQDQINSIQGIGLYRVGLYEITLHVEKPDGKPWFTEQITQVGYKRVRNNKSFFQ